MSKKLLTFKVESFLLFLMALYWSSKCPFEALLAFEKSSPTLLSRKMFFHSFETATTWGSAFCEMYDITFCLSFWSFILALATFSMFTTLDLFPTPSVSFRALRPLVFVSASDDVEVDADGPDEPQSVIIVIGVVAVSVSLSLSIIPLLPSMLMLSKVVAIEELLLLVLLVLLVLLLVSLASAALFSCSSAIAAVSQDSNAGAAVVAVDVAIVAVFAVGSIVAACGISGSRRRGEEGEKEDGDA